MTTLIYGSEISKEIKEELRKEVKEMRCPPYLKMICVGDNPASKVYIRNKEKACAEVGIETDTIYFDKDARFGEIGREIFNFANDDFVDGIMLQLPIPNKEDTDALIALLPPEKDVDGLTIKNIGLLHGGGTPYFAPCTALGIVEMLDRSHIQIDRKKVVVCGRSNLVGTPVARLLQNRGATVTVAHSHTENLAELTKQADIVIAAIGKPKFFTKEYFNEAAAVIDVGINRDENGKLCGDVDFESVNGHVAYLSPVPKGVGPMTVTMLLKNTVTAAKEREREG